MAKIRFVPTAELRHLPQARKEQGKSSCSFLLLRHWWFGLRRISPRVQEKLVFALEAVAAFAVHGYGFGDF
jgi:hypothetical protein